MDTKLVRSRVLFFLVAKTPQPLKLRYRIAYQRIVSVLRNRCDFVDHNRKDEVGIWVILGGFGGRTMNVLSPS